MKALYYSALAHTRRIMGSPWLAPLSRYVQSSPTLERIVRRAKRRAAKVLLPDRRDWVRCESGLAKGLWLHLNLRAEAGYWLGSYEMDVQKLLRNHFRLQSVFYDIGADIGFFALAVANSIGPYGRVFAFEPEQDNFLRIREMVIRNGLQSRLEIVEAAVWSYVSPEGLPFKRGIPPRSHGGIAADGISPVLAEGETHLVPAISLDDFIRRGNPLPHIVKIDVEGGECEVLKGGEELFSRAKPALICEVHRDEAAKWIVDWLAAKEYVPVWQIPDELFPRLLFAQTAERPHHSRRAEHE